MKLDIIMHYEVNEHTGEVVFIGKEEVTVDTAKKGSKVASTLDEDIPRLRLNANNIALNQLACDVLQVKPGDTLHINYPKKDDKYVPGIGASEAFGVKAGNKITKNLTVSFRGASNKKLSEFGTNFEFIESDRKGVFYLKGDSEESAEDAIEIDDSFDLDDLNDLDLNESTDISTIDLTL